jgi:hypothetical protein
MRYIIRSIKGWETPRYVILCVLNGKNSRGAMSDQTECS